MTKKRRFILLIFLLFFFFYIASCTFGKSSVKAGKPFPNITLKTLDEKPFSLNSLKGKIVLINLWASWCLPCIKELPDLQELKRRVNSPSFEVLLVGVSDSKENIAKTYRGLGLTLPVVYDYNGEAYEKLGLSGVPESFVIDSKGRFMVIPAENGILELRIKGPRRWNSLFYINFFKKLLTSNRSTKAS